jgi:hypothetical protein
MAQSEKTKKWMGRANADMKARGTKGLFGKKAAAAGETTREFAIKKYHAAGALGKEARFAANAQGWR